MMRGISVCEIALQLLTSAEYVLSAGRPTANQNLYDGPGAVSTFCQRDK
jgi:hypothetical protein